MCVDRFTMNWFLKLGLKLIDVNNRPNMMSKLWCLCKKNSLNPIIIHAGNQSIAYTTLINNKAFGLIAIYALANYFTRRNLWMDLSNIVNNHKIHWCIIRDYNVVLGSKKHKDSFSPTKTPMREIQNWSNQNYLFQLPTMRDFYTWSNGRLDNYHTIKRLDMTICNMDWIGLCYKTSFLTLAKVKFDNHPLKLEFNFSSIKSSSSFKFMQMWTTHPSYL